MSGLFYDGVPIEQVDFEKEFDKEISILEERLNELKARKKMKDIRNKNYHYWAIKLARANKALEVGQVTLS